MEALESLAPHISLDLSVNGKPLSPNIEDDLAPLLHSREIVQVLLTNGPATESSATARILCVARGNRGSLTYTATAAPSGSPPFWQLTSITRNDEPNTS